MFSKASKSSFLENARLCSVSNAESVPETANPLEQRTPTIVWTSSSAGTIYTWLLMVGEVQTLGECLHNPWQIRVGGH
jgi:hypothetical protein